MRNYIFYFLVFCAALTSCKKDASTSIASKPVVISYLLAGHPATVKVYNQREFSDTAIYGALIGGLKPTISDGSQTVELTETSTGTYTYTDSSFLQGGKTYSLQFTYNGEVVSASTLMPMPATGYKASATTFRIPTSATVADMDAVAVRMAWDNPDSLYHVLVFKSEEANTYKNNNYYPTNFTINAKQAAAYDVLNRQFRYSGIYSAILFTVNKDYVDGLTTNSNTSSQELVNPPGNITNGYGIFTGMQADTIRLSIL